MKILKKNDRSTFLENWDCIKMLLWDLKLIFSKFRWFSGEFAAVKGWSWTCVRLNYFLIRFPRIFSKFSTVMR